MFFVATTISTIGYGNLAPFTPAGKVFTICFSIAGIPLCAFFLYRTAEVMSMCLLWWSHLLHKRFCQKPKQKRPGSIRRKSTADDLVASISDVRMLIIVSIVALVFLMISAVGVHYSMSEMWGYENAVWFVFITMTTIGLGDFVPSWRGTYTSPPDTFAATYVTPFFSIMLTTVGVSFTMAIMQNVGNVFSEELEHLVESREGKSEGSRTMSDSSSASTNSNINRKSTFFGESSKKTTGNNSAMKNIKNSYDHYDDTDESDDCEMVRNPFSRTGGNSSSSSSSKL